MGSPPQPASGSASPHPQVARQTSAPQLAGAYARPVVPALPAGLSADQATVSPGGVVTMLQAPPTAAGTGRRAEMPLALTTQTGSR